MSAPMDPRRKHDEHGEWDALAVGWALSALDREDEELFAAHLPGCARCTATVRESLYTVADLAYALPDEAPPPAMKARLMAAVAAEPRTAAASPSASPEAPDSGKEWPLGEPHPGTPGYAADWFARNQPPAKNEPFPGRGGSDASSTVESPAAKDGPTQPSPPNRPWYGADPAPRDPTDTEDPGTDVRGDPGQTGGQGRVLQPVRGRHSVPEEIAFPGRDEPGVVVPLEPRRRRWSRIAGAAAAVAAVLAVIAALGVWNLQLRSDQNNLKQIVAQREATLQQLTANGPARVAALTADGKPSATRKATLVVRGNQIEIIVETLGATSPNQTYWLWTLRCDTPSPTDLKPIQGFTVAQSAVSVRDIGSEPGAATATCFAISSEEGTATPKTPREVVAVGQPR